MSCRHEIKGVFIQSSVLKTFHLSNMFKLKLWFKFETQFLRFQVLLKFEFPNENEFLKNQYSRGVIFKIYLHI
ncbi:hypothetical protein Syun_017468 [Stephania yunnanensis]|uniref:Uncharacterized protein n=1 Tax=Stephania yunnanensis TaxID=152371 RepID=A0AAP0J985_9MAGN